MFIFNVSLYYFKYLWDLMFNYDNKKLFSFLLTILLVLLICSSSASNKLSPRKHSQEVSTLLLTFHQCLKNWNSNLPRNGRAKTEA